MALHPQVRALLEALRSSPLPPPASLPPAEARRVARANAERYAAPRENVGAVRDVSIEGLAGALPLRVYTPPREGPCPAVLFFHGGGFLFGGLDEVDDVARFLARHAACVVVSVGYHLAPEFPFPAAPEDAFTALTWVQDHADDLGVDAGRLAVAGDSAGGNLAAAVCLMARDRGVRPPRLQLLVYPVVDFAHPERYPSTEVNGEGYLLTSGEMEIFRDNYLRDVGDADDPYASPILANLEGLPPAWVLTAGYDPLRDQGVAYADRLREAGVPVAHSAYDDMIHGFFTMAGVFDRGKEAQAEAVERLRRALGAAAAGSDRSTGGPGGAL